MQDIKITDGNPRLASDTLMSALIDATPGPTANRVGPIKQSEKERRLEERQRKASSTHRFTMRWLRTMRQPGVCPPLAMAFKFLGRALMRTGASRV